MARGRRKKEKVERVIKIKRSEVRAFYAELGRVKDQQSSYAGKAGSDTRNFSERTGLSKIAIGFISRLDRLGDDIKRQTVMDEVIMLFDAMGFNDQGNLFDRATAKMENDLVDDEEGTDPDDNKDLRPPFLQNAMPLDEAEQKFEAAKKKSPPKPPKGDALSALAGDEPPLH